MKVKLERIPKTAFTCLLKYNANANANSNDANTYYYYY